MQQTCTKRKLNQLNAMLALVSCQRKGKRPETRYYICPVCTPSAKKEIYHLTSTRLADKQRPKAGRKAERQHTP